MRNAAGCRRRLAAVPGAMPARREGFFEGKTITYIIATNPGGGYDTYGRLIGKLSREAARRRQGDLQEPARRRPYHRRQHALRVRSPTG